MRTDTDTHTRRTLNAADTARAQSARTNDEPLWLVTEGDELFASHVEGADVVPNQFRPPADLIALTEPCRCACHRLPSERIQAECPCSVKSCTRLFTLQGERPYRYGTVDLGEWRVEQVVPDGEGRYAYRVVPA